MTDMPPFNMTVRVGCECGNPVPVRFHDGQPAVVQCERCGRRISITHEVADATDAAGKAQS